MSLNKSNSPTLPPCRRGPACQQPRRQAEHQARHEVLDFRNRTARLGITCPDAARRLGIAPRTLRHWQQRSREGQLKPYPRGRPARRSPRWLRNQVVQLLCLTGPSVGTPTLEATFSTMPRSELKDILRRFRRVWQYQNQRLIHRLRWHHPGTVWAVDHVQPDQPIDGVYPYALSVRDLASHYQLAWQPVPDVGAETTIAVLASLFWKHGPPLVLKSDNGSAFIARDTGQLLATWGILHLRNPRMTPQYNGSCEAANGSQKKVTEDQAALAAHPGRWTSYDLQQARMIRNRLGRPWGHRGPTPEQVWQSRLPITSTQRSQLNTAVQRYRQEERTRRGIPDEAALGDAAQASVDRVAISRALKKHGYLSVTRRLVTPPIKPRGAAIFP
jgi:Spy/CpxP family protein refolding chaperone